MAVSNQLTSMEADSPQLNSIEERYSNFFEQMKHNHSDWSDQHERVRHTALSLHLHLFLYIVSEVLENLFCAGFSFCLRT
jgi:hypothetical protein